MAKKTINGLIGRKDNICRIEGLNVSRFRSSSSGEVFCKKRMDLALSTVMARAYLRHSGLFHIRVIMRFVHLGLCLALAACGGGASDSVIIVTPDPGALYTVEPDVANCKAGTLSDGEKQKALATVNTIRALHNLPAVTYDSSSDAAVTAAALIMTANNVLTHSPTSDLHCYSSLGVSGAGSSNLYKTSGQNMTSVLSATPIEAFLTDVGIDTLGHRRWILDPFLSKTAFGRVDGTKIGTTTKVMSVALKVIGGPDANLGASKLTYVAYPQGNYPSKYVSKSWYLSFSALPDRTSHSGNTGSHVDYSFASVQVFDQALTPMTVTDLAYDYQGYGLANNLQWKVAGLQDGVTYRVKINNVRINGAQMPAYDYTFKLVP